MSTNAVARPVHTRKPRPTAAAAPAQPATARLPGIPFLTLEEIPDTFGMVLRGDCLAPELNDGDAVVFVNEMPKVGDFAIFILKPELVTPGALQCAIKRLAMAPPPWVTFPYVENPRSEVHALVLAEQLNPPGCFHIPCSRLLAVRKFSHVQARAAR